MNRSYNQLVSLEGDLREAISKDQLSLHYQPKVDVESGYINGLEALVRWKHPAKGVISPNEFIPLAEETGLITRIDEWVLYEACRQNQEWIELGYAPERIAVNVSASEIQKDDFAYKVQRILAITGLAPEYLEIEVTENSVMQHTEDCIRTMQYLKSMGVSLAIDDFGTGYSSLSYLRQFPIHYLKIDQTFTKDVLTDPSDAEIVKAMIRLADAFKLGVVAEGVESEEVLAFLKENQCQFYQGYYFSRPLPPEEIVHLLTKQSVYKPKENPRSS
ncbi:EAL domain-containing protein [Halobacillus shinanisalinarum]|uniref:EAL domain-containing protein n=1 Tax=Halobacillus shinanisalinarum TaxID=2932258 RepID=A0ABY4GWH1_9BACI|nr:EAL domain-containing protein [Halobacillus shinanisalinarum]UOQ92516.1 EAL domain-containing protein [Halobacillus shinanisalinarum]